jgi:hypothetical protein
MWTCEQADAMADEWGFNCGPAAICAVTEMTPEQLRPHMGDFEGKHYTNPTLMREILERIKVPYHCMTDSRGAKDLPWPSWGLVRVQWGGPWTREGRPMVARYRHTHWVASDRGINGSLRVFDVNATCVGGWIDYDEWDVLLVPWLLKQCEPRADGRWWVTHSIQIFNHVLAEDTVNVLLDKRPRPSVGDPAPWGRWKGNTKC